VLMYASDYPHSESPNSVVNIPGWSSLPPETKKKLLRNNAARCSKRTGV
jgi:predicted TIM-barrel fold metal-dependent hydrolase